MENTQPGKMEAENGSNISDASPVSKPKGNMPLGASKNLLATTTATTRNASRKIWKKTELEALQLKIGLVAGALADFQTAHGLVAIRPVETTLASGRVVKGLKIFLVADGLEIQVNRTVDGLDFLLVAEDEKVIGT